MPKSAKRQGLPKKRWIHSLLENKNGLYGFLPYFQNFCPNAFSRLRCFRRFFCDFSDFYAISCPAIYYWPISVKYLLCLVLNYLHTFWENYKFHQNLLFVCVLTFTTPFLVSKFKIVLHLLNEQLSYLLFRDFVSFSDPNKNSFKFFIRIPMKYPLYKLWLVLRLPVELFLASFLVLV